MSGIKRCVDNIIKSASDKRFYRGLELQNGMKVLLISDETTDKSAASLDVNVGHLSDPDELPGLAHFCEHMLFRGTEKYPSENEYDKFLSEHGGSFNACTYSDHTKYYFDVAPEHLSGALDRFGQFFQSPLFTENVSEREVRAVNSEHEKNIPDDGWRIDQLEKSNCKKSHSFRKFGTGNIQTLDVIPKEKGINVRSELLKFHDTWYSSNIMSLAILGKESLDELEKITVDIFSGIKNKNVVAPTWPEHPYGPEQMNIKEYAVPIKDLRWLTISFPTSDFNDYYKASPSYYLSHLLGHEGPGSLLSLLRRRSWCNSLSSGGSTPARGFGFFSVNASLTEEGIDHIDEIIKLVFQYVNMLKREQPQKRIFEERQEMRNVYFRFKSKGQPIDYTSGIVHDLHEFPLEEILCGDYLIEWRPDLINKALDYLSPDNARIVVVSQKYADIATESEPWYGTKYKLETISENTINHWKEVDYCKETWTNGELLAAMEQLTQDKVEGFVPQFLSKMFIECLIHGNASKESAIQLVNLVEKKIQKYVTIWPLLPHQLLKNRELQLMDRSNFVFKVYNSIHRSSCNETYYQCNMESTQNNVVLELLVQIIKEPCFSVLRTKEQLGYTVFCRIHREKGVQGLLITVQSERHPNYVDKRVEAFLHSMVDHIRNLSTEEFERHKEALASLRLEKPKNLSDLSWDFWSEITSKTYNFDRNNIEVEHLRTLEKQNILDFADDLINITAPHRHKLAVHMISTAEGGAGTESPHLSETVSENMIDGFLQPPSEYEEPVVIENIISFKSSQGMFPLVQPYVDIVTQMMKS